MFGYIKQILNSWPWQGQEMVIPGSNGMTEGLGSNLVLATEEAARYPGLYQAYQGDCPTIQLTMRTGWYVDPDDLGFGLGSDEGGPNG